MTGSFIKTPLLRVLAADETRTSTTTPTDLTGMSFTVAAGETWQIEGWVSYTTPGTNGGYAFNLATPSGTTSGLYIEIADPPLFTPMRVIPNYTINIGGNGDFSGFGGLFRFSGALFITTSGTVSLQAAQNSSNATATTFKAGSYIKATKV